MHKLVTVGMGQFMLARYHELNVNADCLSDETIQMLHRLAKDPCSDAVMEQQETNNFGSYYHAYLDFKAALRDGQHGKTAKF